MSEISEHIMHMRVAQSEIESLKQEIKRLKSQPTGYYDNTSDVNKAHRAGWEQAKREAVRIAKQKAGHVGYPIDCCQEDYENYLIGSDIADAIAAMEYKEQTNE